MVPLTHLRHVATGRCRSTSLLLAPDQFASFTPDGRIEQIRGLEDELVAIVKTENGQQMLSMEELEAMLVKAAGSSSQDGQCDH